VLLYQAIFLLKRYLSIYYHLIFFCCVVRYIANSDENVFIFIPDLLVQDNFVSLFFGFTSQISSYCFFSRRPNTDSRMSRMRNPKLHFPLFFRLRGNYTFYTITSVLMLSFVLQFLSVFRSHGFNYIFLHLTKIILVR